MVLVDENFNNGLSDQWQILYGEPILSNGKLTASSDLWLAIGDPAWRNVQIDMQILLEIGGSTAAEAPAQIIPRFTDRNNFISFRANQCCNVNAAWLELKNGTEWSLVEGTLGPGIPGYEWQHLTIKVEGDKYTALINNRIHSYTVNNKYPFGALCLWLGKAISIDDLKVVALP